MKTLITGASGKIGQYLIGSLSQEHELILTSSSKSSDLKYLELDITSPDQIKNILSQNQPDAIIHLAGIVGKICENKPELAYKVNVESTKLLAEEAVRIGVKKFIFASSAAVYPQNLNRALKEEDTKPGNNYGNTKAQAEDILRKIANKSTMKIISLRIFNVYGQLFNDSLVNKLIASSSSSKSKVEIFNPQYFIRDYINIDDVAKAFSLTMGYTSRDNFNVFNIASGKRLSTLELIEILKSKGMNPRYNIKVNNEVVNSMFADVTKAREELHFEATTSF